MICKDNSTVPFSNESYLCLVLKVFICVNNPQPLPPTKCLWIPPAEIPIKKANNKRATKHPVFFMINLDVFTVHVELTWYKRIAVLVEMNGGTIDVWAF